MACNPAAQTAHAQEQEQIQDIEDMLKSKTFSSAQIISIRSSLVGWFHQNRRRLPWRGDAPPYSGSQDVKKAADAAVGSATKSGPLDRFMFKKKKDAANRARASPGATRVTNVGTSCPQFAPPQPPGPVHGVPPYCTWVSEIMLQQTRVETVIEYYNKWVAKWPDVQSLAAASPDETPAVDGNVVRVISRLLAIGDVDAKAPKLSRRCAELAALLVDPEQPSDFNQAMMELGATLCTARGPRCAVCPLNAKGLCQAAAVWGVESGRGLQQNGTEQSVTTVSAEQAAMFPRSTKRKPPREQVVALCVVRQVAGAGEPDTERFLVVRRPPEGLLAGQWEFPSVMLIDGLDDKRDSGGKFCELGGSGEGKVKVKAEAGGGGRLHLPSKGQRSAAINAHAAQHFNIDLCAATEMAGARRMYLGELHHEFSHRRHHMLVEQLSLEASPSLDMVASQVGRAAVDSAATAPREMKWATRAELHSVGLTAGMVKVLRLVDKHNKLDKTSKDVEEKKIAVGASRTHTGSKRKRDTS
eukprot:g2063.t1